MSSATVVFSLTAARRHRDPTGRQRLGLLTPFVITSCARTAASRPGDKIGARILTPHRSCVCGFVRTQALIAPRALVTVPIRQVRMGACLVPLHVKKHGTDHGRE
jgi:hypothetical protein